MQRPPLRSSEETRSFLLNSTGCPQATSTHRIVFDVGMNNGDDSFHYLSKGYRVVAVEANPILAQRGRMRFQTEIAAGRMAIEHVGICERPGKIPFWINEKRDVFSSFDRSRAGREGMPCHSVEIECITFDALLEKHGLPYYLKLDAEGAEPFCLKSLQSIGLPEYVSVEAESLEYLLLLWQLGYRQFKVVDQMRHNSNLPYFTNDYVISRLAKRMCGYADRFKNRAVRVTFPRGSSGPFGEETPGTWQTLEEAAYNYLHLQLGHNNRGNLNPDSWYDFHAKAAGPTLAAVSDTGEPDN